MWSQGGDIDESVIAGIEYCDTFVVFGSKKYGENTGNQVTIQQTDRHNLIVFGCHTKEGWNLIAGLHILRVKVCSGSKEANHPYPHVSMKSIIVKHEIHHFRSTVD